MAHDHSKRAKVRTSYVQGLPLTTAAEVNHVPYNTARAWKRADATAGHDWDLLRNARRMSKSGVEEMANEVLGELAEQFLATTRALKADAVLQEPKLGPEARARIMVQLMDGYNKAISASTRAMPNANRLAVAMDVIRFLTQVLGDRFPKLRAPFVDAVEQLGDDLVREFGARGV